MQHYSVRIREEGRLKQKGAGKTKTTLKTPSQIEEKAKQKRIQKTLKFDARRGGKKNIRKASTRKKKMYSRKILRQFCSRFARPQPRPCQTSITG